MNKYLLFIGGPLIVIVVAVSSYFLIFNKKQLPNKQTQPIVDTGEKKTLKELFDMGGSQKCQFNDNAGSTGTLYVGNGQLKAEYVSLNGDVTLKTHILTDGQTAYTWVDGQSTGFKMSFTAIADYTNPSGNAPATTQQPGYKCAEWTVDPSVFVIPNVTFKEYTNIQVAPIDPENESTESGQALDCSICDSSPDSSKDKCLKALGCI